MPDDESTSGDDQDPPAESDLAAAVDEALEDEVKRQKARFIQQIMGVDRIEGTGRLDEYRERGSRPYPPDDSDDSDS
ncbi:hypothetical protein LQ327_08160 [Actinomycetospora endophytica]|uniref:Uncharacterized protein n=1 Tax=Actinomycetospora endophytica TaxID=2291215 RepID=A0ABS8P8J5_9PSEU|nr:hypothetical protein [Actinomycetospora endophytica]MCD2193359.1 hypothetical protein [Actinomycetospora endophytica]